MNRAALAALLSHWRRQPGQLATLLVGLALATALWSGVQAINAEARASYDRAAGVLGRDSLPSLTAPTGAIPLDTYIALRRAGWRLTPLLEGEIRIDDRRYKVTGVDYLAAPAEVLPRAAGEAPDRTALLTAPGRVFAAPETVAELEDADMPPRIAARNLPPRTLVTDIGAAERLLGRTGELTRLLIRKDQPLGRRRPLDAIAPGLSRNAPQTRADIARLTDSFHLNLTAFGLLSFTVGLFIVHGTIGLAFEQRRPVFRTLRALGVPARRLMALLLAELLALAVIAGIAGLVLGYLVAGLLLPDVAATLSGLYGARVPGSLTFRPSWALAGMAIAVAGTLVAGTDALAQVARLPLLAAAQPRAWQRASARRLGRQAILAALFLVAAAVLGRLGLGLAGGFAMLGALLVGAALLLPPVLSALLALAGRTARRPVAQWFWADTRQQLAGLSLALMALLLALAANIGVGTMVSSFRLTFTSYLDQRLAAELYVTTESEAQARRLRPWLAERTRAVLPIRSVETEVLGRPATILGIADHATYRDNWPMLRAAPGVWNRLAAGEGVLVNEQLFRQADIALGQPLALTPDWRLPVAGIYSDYGNPSAQLMVSGAALAAHLPDAAPGEFALRLPDAEVPALRDALIAEFGLPADNVIDQASLKAFSLGIFDRTFAVTGALNVLTLAVAGFAILTSLLTLSRMRLPQLAPLWALGLTRRHLACLEVVRSLVLAALTFLLALPTGLVLAWVLLAVVNVEAFGWRLPMHVFPRDWLGLFAAALVAALLASLAPIRRLARTPPAEFLKVFANER